MAKAHFQRKSCEDIRLLVLCLLCNIAGNLALYRITLQPLCATHGRPYSHTRTQSYTYHLSTFPAVVLVAFCLLSYILHSRNAVTWNRLREKHGRKLGLAPSDCVRSCVLWPTNNMFVH